MSDLRCLGWWVDRWRQSSAFVNMTLEEQGAYRNLLDEAHLRGGALPNNERILAKACGDAMAWDRVRDVVMARFELREDGWHNVTLDKVVHHAKKRAEKQKRWRENSGGGNKGGNKGGNGAGNAPGNGAGNAKGDQDQDQDQDQVQDLDQTVPAPTAPPSAPKNGAVSVSRFEQFWAVYPAKKGKEAALKAWKKLKPSETLTDTIIAAVQKQVTWPDWTDERGRFVPNPSTWLNQGRWDDEPRLRGAPVAVNPKTAGNAEAMREFLRRRGHVVD